MDGVANMIAVVQLLVQKSGPKYKKSNSGVAWSGRGKAPEWIESKNRSQFII